MKKEEAIQELKIMREIFRDVYPYSETALDMAINAIERLPEDAILSTDEN